MNTNFQPKTIEQDYKETICPTCLYVGSCKRGLYAQHDEQAGVTSLKCSNIEHKRTEEEIEEEERQLQLEALTTNKEVLS